ncbi:hypothetical protein [uncultured Helicobacter sp.]|uniref:hypothetical protein n=1 Tax=uncultured Helicobacter sp. TaxID=175537 RepID=UPI002610C55E|nr:hypothetical protein [uncultured Helicobacter sp.]
MRMMFYPFMIVALALVCVSSMHAKKRPPVDGLMVSIRTMSTGELLYANSKNNETNWSMIEVLLPGYLGRKFPFGAVQFRHVRDGEKCLMSNGFWFSLGECDSVRYGDDRTLFSLLPTSSGALQIQSIAADGCLAVESSGKKLAQNLKIQPCFSAENTPIDLRWLWILTPPVLEAKISR